MATVRENNLRRFLAKATLFAVVYALALFIAGTVFMHAVPWKEAQDPRTRLLWDGRYDGSKIVLFGDSVFSSSYVDSTDQTLWKVLEQKSGQKVFPAALEAAQTADLLAMATLVSRSWPPGTLVFMDVIPTRFILTRKPTGPGEGNYRAPFSKLVPIQAGVDCGGMVDTIQRGADYLVGSSFFLVRNSQAIKTWLASLVAEPNYFRNGRYHHTVWSSSNGAARTRFDSFRDTIITGPQHKGFDLLEQLETVLAEKGIGIVFVLSPANKELIRAYSGAESSRILSTLDRIHHDLLLYLKAGNYRFIDLYDRIDGECFADMVHPNSSGDRIIAAAINDWISEQGTTR